MKINLNTIFWLLVLLALSIMSGILTIFSQNPFIPRDEYLIMAIIGIAVTILIFGGISFAVYYFLKRRHSTIARKRALQVYGFLTAIFTIVGFVKFNDATAKRDRYESEQLKLNEFLTIIEEKFQDSTDPKAQKMLKESYRLFNCVSVEMEYDNEALYREFLTTKNLRSFVLYNKTYNEIEKRCIKEIAGD